MLLSRLTPAVEFKIWNPQWRDRVVLLADYKLATHNKIVFPKAKSLEGEWYISGTDAKKYPTEPFKTKTGTTMTMRAVPIDALQPLERSES